MRQLLTCHAPSSSAAPYLHISACLQQGGHRFWPAIVGHNVQGSAAVAGGGAPRAASGFRLFSGCQVGSGLEQQRQVAQEQLLAAGGLARSSSCSVGVGEAACRVVGMGSREGAGRLQRRAQDTPS